jgi:transposase InsO family protein
MCLAEALLPTTDAQTRDRLIAEKIGSADWAAHLGKYLTFYNIKRPHQALDGNTPDSAYFNPPQPIPVAA